MGSAGSVCFVGIEGWFSGRFQGNEPRPPPKDPAALSLVRRTVASINTRVSSSGTDRQNENAST